MFNQLSHPCVPLYILLMWIFHRTKGFNLDETQVFQFFFWWIVFLVSSLRTVCSPLGLNYILLFSKSFAIFSILYLNLWFILRYFWIRNEMDWSFFYSLFLLVSLLPMDVQFLQHQLKFMFQIRMWSFLANFPWRLESICVCCGVVGQDVLQVLIRACWLIVLSSSLTLLIDRP